MWVPLRNAPAQWSSTKSKDLSEFIAENVISEDDIEELDAIITKAKDEQPIQKFIEENRRLLAALLMGNQRYCIPRKRLGGEYIPHFIIGDADSGGIRCLLFELDTPKSGIYLKDGLQLDVKARKGVSQVIGKRNWVSSNIAHARQRGSENSLGLFDIREKADAIVLVGGRLRMPETKDAQRNEYRQSDNIHIHSYDWLLKKLYSAIRL